MEPQGIGCFVKCLDHDKLKADSSTDLHARVCARNVEEAKTVDCAHLQVLNMRCLPWGKVGGMNTADPNHTRSRIKENPSGRLHAAPGTASVRVSCWPCRPRGVPPCEAPLVACLP